MSSASNPSTSTGFQRRRGSRVPPELRKRTTRACDACRRKRLRCNGGKPCQRCTRSGARCEFAGLGLAQPSTSNSTVATRVSYLEYIVQHLRPEISCDLESLEDFATKIANEKANAPEAGRTVEKPNMDVASDASDSGERTGLNTIETPDISIIVYNQGKTHFDGESSQWSFFNSVRGTVTGSKHTLESEDHPDQRPLVKSSFGSLLDDPHVRTAFAFLPPRNVADFLVATFFRYAHGNYFYMHIRIFTRKMDALYDVYANQQNGFAPSVELSVEFLCVVLMVLAIGSQYAHLEAESQPERAKLHECPKDPLDYTQSDLPDLEQNHGMRFYEAARMLLSYLVLACSMTSVQACALMGAFVLSMNSRDISYTYLGLALKMAVNMGMHRSCERTEIHDYVQEFRNRLWWTVYTLDRKIGIAMGRPFTIDDAEIDTAFPKKLDAFEADGMNGSVDNQIALVKICRIMGDIVKKVFTSSVSAKRGGRRIHARSIESLRKKLESWEAELPEHLRLRENSSRAVTHLHLTHQQAVTLLTRSFLSYSIGRGITPLTERPAEDFLSQCTRDCLAASRTSVRLMARLRERFLLSRYSFFDFLYCSAALYVLLLGTKSKVNDLYQPDADYIRECLRVLRLLSVGSESARASLRLILSRGFLDSLKQNDFGSLNQGAVEDNFTDGSRAWKEWISCLKSSPHRTTPSPTFLPSSQDGFVEGRLNVSRSLPTAPERASPINSNTSVATGFDSPSTVATSSRHVLRNPEGQSIEGADDVAFCFPDLGMSPLLNRDFTDAPFLNAFGLDGFPFGESL